MEHYITLLALLRQTQKMTRIANPKPMAITNGSKSLTYEANIVTLESLCTGESLDCMV